MRHRRSATRAPPSIRRRRVRNQPGGTRGTRRRCALCTARLLAALWRVLLIPRHASARIDATAALVILSLEPANKVRIVRTGAVLALVEVLCCSGGGSAPPEALEHATGALFGLALAKENRAAIGVLGVVPPLPSSSPLLPNKDKSNPLSLPRGNDTHHRRPSLSMRTGDQQDHNGGITFFYMSLFLSWLYITFLFGCTSSCC